VSLSDPSNRAIVFFSKEGIFFLIETVILTLAVEHIASKIKYKHVSSYVNKTNVLFTMFSHSTGKRKYREEQARIQVTNIGVKPVQLTSTQNTQHHTTTRKRTDLYWLHTCPQ